MILPKFFASIAMSQLNTCPVPPGICGAYVSSRKADTRSWYAFERFKAFEGFYPYALYYSPCQRRHDSGGSLSVQLYDSDAGLIDYLQNFFPGFIDKYTHSCSKGRQFGYDSRCFFGRDRCAGFP